MNTHRGRILIGLIVALVIWGYLDVRRRGYATPAESHKSDLTVYTEAGAAFFDGRPPYHVSNPRGWTYVYPPVFALLLAPLYVLPMQEQVFVWFLVCLTMCWGIYRESAKLVALVRKPEDDQKVGFLGWLPWLGAITAAAIALPTLNCLQRGQVSVAVLYLLLLGLRLVIDGRSTWIVIAGGIVLALSVAIKVVPILPIAMLLWIQLVGYLRQLWRHSDLTAELGRRWMAATSGVVLGLVLFFLLVPAALIGWSNNLRHLGTWCDLVLVSAGDSTATPGFEKDTHSVRNQCLGNALYRLGNFGAYLFAGGPIDPLIDGENPPPRMMDDPSVNTILLGVRVALLLALMIVGIRLGMQEDPLLSQAAGFGLACLALLIVSPVARNHYFEILAPAVLFVPMWLRRRGLRRTSVAMAVVPGILIFLQYALLAYVGRVGLLGLGITAWLMAAMILVERSGRSPAVVDDRPKVLPTTFRRSEAA